MTRDEDFDALTTARDGDIDLARAALIIARDEYPALDIAHYLGVLDALADAAREALGGEGAAEARLGSVDRILFTAEGFSGNSDNYYDPDNSYLNQVLDRREGIPITLCVVYLEVAARLGVSLEPVGFPSHFILAHDDGTRRRFIDPFHGGQRLEEAELRSRLANLVGRDQADSVFTRVTAAVPRREVVARMLRNLKLIHSHSGDWPRALAVSHRLVTLESGVGPELRDRARILEHLDAFSAAAADYERYLASHPHAGDAADVERRLGLLRARESRLN